MSRLLARVGHALTNNNSNRKFAYLLFKNTSKIDGCRLKIIISWQKRNFSSSTAWKMMLSGENAALGVVNGGGCGGDKNSGRGGGRCGTLTMENLNPNILNVEYAVRGPLVIRAGEIEKELKQ
uniref:Uncharacterized protein n=1 Tax=Romanomermis culicivorax TaxID=13658 RepID=A0A915IWQ6_ROMCU